MRPLRFLHIPKTAGTTFTSILQRPFLINETFRFTGNIDSDRERFEALPKEERERVMLFTGHAGITTGIKRADDAITITFLRDPISRVKSFCQHVSEGKSPYLLDKFPPQTFNLDAFLESGNDELSNLQTKMLISQDPSTLLKDTTETEIINLTLDTLYNKISHFGLQEYFDESLIIFASDLNCRIPFYSSQNKKNTAMLLQFEKHHVAKIASLNKIDLEVYRLAKEHFLASLKISSLANTKLRCFQFINKLGGSVGFPKKVHK